MVKLTKAQFQQKKKYADLVLVVEIFAILIIAIWTIFNKDKGGYYDNFFAVDRYYWSALFTTTASLTIIADFVYAFLSCWQNERINLSQTWNLIPISSPRLWLTNILSSIFTCVYLFLLQLFLLFLLALPYYGDKNPLRATLNTFGLWPGSHMWLMVFWRLLFIVLTAFFVYIFVSFINFLSKTIVDHLAVKNTLWVRMLVIAILIIVAVYFGTIFVGHFDHLLDRYETVTQLPYDPIFYDDLIILGANILFGGLDLWLFSHYVEAKIDH